jgi:hypothetical protein
MRTSAPQQTATVQAPSAFAPWPQRSVLPEANQRSGLGAIAGVAPEYYSDPSELLCRSYSFAQLPIFSKPQAGLQAKLAIGQPNDGYEQEADQVAEQVMRMPEPRLLGDAALSGLALNSQGGQQSSKLDRIQTKPVGANSASQLSVPPIVNEILNAPGQPLDAQTRAYFEPRFGHDFGQIRIHSDARAAESARAVNALAYTNGRDIVVGTGQYAPATNFGRRLLAHELTHVMQYRNAPGGSGVRRGVAARGDPAEVEARFAANQMAAGVSIFPQARPSTALMLYTDEEDLDPEEYLQERSPQFTNQEVGTWGNTWSAILVARERLTISFPEQERSHAIVEAIAQHAPVAILHEYGRLWLYRLEWEGLSGRYSRFTNAETIFHEGTNERGNYSVSNVQGRQEVEAFVTEDGGVLSPPGAGKLFSHTGGEFEDPLVSKFHNAKAFLGGLEKGLEGANFTGLAKRLQAMAALNTVFPAPFAMGALHGLANEIIELAQWLNPQQWKAVEAAARQAILILNDPDGEQLAATLGEEFGRTQAATLDALLQKSLPVFAYEVGKLIGPTIIETVLAFIGIEIGTLTMIQKTLDAVGEVPRLVGVLRGAQRAFPEIPDRPGFPRRVEREGFTMADEKTEGLPEEGHLPTPSHGSSLPDLSATELELLARTGNSAEFPGALPKDLADQELAIVRRARKVPIEEGDGKYINEVDLSNGHRWKEQANNGTWCRFSNGATNCTIVFDEPMPKLPGTVVAHAPTKAALRDIYFGWAEYRAAANVEVALLRSRGTPEYPKGTYAVVVGDVDEVAFPGRSKDWITIAHSHTGVPDQPGFVNPSGADLEASVFGSYGRTSGRIRKWVHSQMPDGEWREVEYGLDLDRERYYIQPTGGESLFFKEVYDPALKRSDLAVYGELRQAGREAERIDLMIEQNAIEYYLGWYARQFVFDE